MYNQKMKISVIIPVYNSEAYLTRCVNSVLRQTYADIELILVDDGATDGSGQICDAFAAADSRVRVLHQQNRGQSAARNAGIRMAGGDYLTFLDSDDYWMRDTALEEMAELIHGTPACDVLMFGYQKIWADTGKRSLKCVTDVPSKCGDIPRYLLKKGEFSNSACNKLVKRDYLIEHKLFFSEGLLCEDVEWCGKLLRTSAELLVFPHPVMVYEVKTGTSSAPKEISYRSFISVLTRELEQIAKEQDEGLQNKCFAYWAYQISWFLGYPPRIGKSCEKDAALKLKPFLHVMNHASDRKARLVAICLRTMGMENTMRLISRFLAG